MAEVNDRVYREVWGEDPPRQEGQALQPSQVPVGAQDEALGLSADSSDVPVLLEEMKVKLNNLAMEVQEIKNLYWRVVRAERERLWTQRQPPPS